MTLRAPSQGGLTEEHTFLRVVARDAHMAPSLILTIWPLSAFCALWRLNSQQKALPPIAITPGPTETELFRANNPQGSEGEARYLTRIQTRRFAQPGEIAAAIAFLASEQAAFITGQTLFVDGGASPAGFYRTLS